MASVYSIKIRRSLDP